MRIEIIVPIIVDYLFQGLLESIEANTVQPDRIILVDNTPGKNFFVKSKIPITKITTKTGKVNESWNKGIANVSKETDFVGVYNDDIVLNSRFFQRLLETFLWPKGPVGVACPNTVPVDVSLNRGRVVHVHMGKKEGWCFTLRKSMLDKIPKIPDNLVTFYGDDWFWKHSHNLGYIWAKDLGNPIHHYGGISVLESGERLRKRPEYFEWQKLKTTISKEG